MSDDILIDLDQIKVKRYSWTVVLDQEDDGRWIAEVLEVPGALAYGATKDEASAAAREIARAVVDAREGA